MPEENRINRREFIHRSTLGGAAVGVALEELNATAPDPVAPVPANDKITVGMIGVGARARELMPAIMTLPNTEIVGVCDAYTGRVERAAARSKGRAKVYKDYRTANLSSTFNNQTGSEGGGFQILFLLEVSRPGPSPPGSRSGS
jgi:hypothetical protein